MVTMNPYLKAALFLLLGLPFGIHAEDYKCIKNSHTVYSDSPCDKAGIARLRNSIKPSKDLAEGLAAFEHGLYDLAYEKLAPLSESGVAMAQNTLGKMYLNGQGVPKDADKALVLFRKAANQGLANAQTNVGVMYAAGSGVQQDYEQAIVWFKKAANQGFAIAMSNLAEMYENGLGVYPDRIQADMWRKKSKEIDSARNGASVTIETVGTEQYKRGLDAYYRFNFTNAAELFRLAAEKGHPEAQLRLALMYQNGQGVLKDAAQAQYWTQKAKDGKHALGDNRDRVIMHDTSGEKFKRKIDGSPLTDERP